MRIVIQSMALKCLFFFQKITKNHVNNNNCVVIILMFKVVLWCLKIISTSSISGRVDRASATETVDAGLIPGRFKPKTLKFGIYSFPAR